MITPAEVEASIKTAAKTFKTANRPAQELAQFSWQYAKDIGKGAWRGAKNTPFMGRNGAAMWAAGGAAAGAVGDLAFNDGNDIAGSAAKGALMGGVGRYAASAARGGYRAGKRGYADIAKVWKESGGEVADIAKAAATGKAAPTAAAVAAEAPVMQATAKEAFAQGGAESMMGSAWQPIGETPGMTGKPWAPGPAIGTPGADAIRKAGAPQRDSMMPGRPWRPIGG